MLVHAGLPGVNTRLRAGQHRPGAGMGWTFSPPSPGQYSESDQLSMQLYNRGHEEEGPPHQSRDYRGL